MSNHPGHPIVGNIIATAAGLRLVVWWFLRCCKLGKITRPIGRGPKHITAHLIGDILLVRLQGVLTVAEQQLVHTLSERGRDLLKQVRTQLIETARPVLETLIQEITGEKFISLHHDISVITGEEVILFTLPQTPPYRQTKKK